jgi:choline dehydrogenase
MKKIFNYIILCSVSTCLLMPGNIRASDFLDEEFLDEESIELTFDEDDADADDFELMDDLEAKQCHKTKGHKKRHKRSSKTVDYVIVGLGTAGAVVARNLSNDFDNNVLVLEAGINRTTDPIVLNPNPTSSTPSIQNIIAYDPRYSETFPIALFSPREILSYTEGRMWGGSSAHNYVNAVRGTPPIYDYWAATSGNPLWSYNNLLPYMLAMENYNSNGTTPNAAQRGLAGTLYITQSPPANTDSIAEAFTAVTGAPYVSDYNDPTQSPVFAVVGASQNYVTPGANSVRSFSIPAFLPIGTVIDSDGKGLDGRNLRIVSNAQATRVLFKGNKAVGVEYILSNDNNKVVQVFARKKVILSAGAINTPAILQRSGIGDPAILEPLGIPVVVASPNVGANLVTQYGVEGIISGPGGTANFIPFADMRGFSYPADGQRRVQFALVNLGPTRTGILGWILHSKSTGTVQIVDPNPLVQPLVNFNLYSDGPVTQPGTDAYTAVSIFKVIREIAVNLGRTIVYPPVADFASDATLLTDAKAFAGFSLENHASSTAKMSTSIASGVVDGNLNVFGVTNLMVADNSAVPLIEDGNTAYQAYLIGFGASAILNAEAASSQ